MWLTQYSFVRPTDRKKIPFKETPRVPSNRKRSRSSKRRRLFSAIRSSDLVSAGWLAGYSCMELCWLVWDWKKYAMYRRRQQQRWWQYSKQRHFDVSNVANIISSYLHESTDATAASNKKRSELLHRVLRPCVAVDCVSLVNAPFSRRHLYRWR